jgi:hypothetical protein
MKNHRGTALSNVRSSMWRIFGVERLPRIKSNASAADIVEWKKNLNVINCFSSLFEINNNGLYWMTAIARSAFSESAVPTLSHTHCAFALAVCNIYLNPRSKGIVCDEKQMKLRMDKYIVRSRQSI